MLLLSHAGFYAEAFSTSREGRVVPQDCQLRRVKYLNNVIKQEHRFIKRKVRASQCFKRFHTAERTSEGIEAVNMIRKRQVKRLTLLLRRFAPTHVRLNGLLYGVAHQVGVARAEAAEYIPDRFMGVRREVIPPLIFKYGRMRLLISGAYHILTTRHVLPLDRYSTTNVMCACSYGVELRCGTTARQPSFKIAR